MNPLTESLVTIFVGLTSVAILAVIVSRRSNTSGVITALFGGYATALEAAVSPITGDNAVGLSSITSGSGMYLNNFPQM